MNKKLKKNLLNLNLCVVSHIFATGPALELEEYLKDKTKSLLFIGHYFPFANKQGSFYRQYQGNFLLNKTGHLNWKIISPFIYLKEFIYTVFTVLINRKTIDLYIGSDNFSSYIGLFLKKVGLVKEVVLYTIDYSPKRFTNPILNYLYYYFDRVCLRGCRIVWNVSESISTARKSYSHLDPKKHVKQIVVPLGAWIDRIKPVPSAKRKGGSIVFMGHLLEKQGVQMVIEAFPDIVKKVPEAVLKIIGTGPYEKSLKLLAAKYGLGKRINFMGYIEDHREVERELTTSQIAIATYKPDPDSFTYFADPGKIKNYLACGLPIVLTDVPAIAKVIEKRRCGLITRYDKKEVTEAITSLLLDKNRLMKYSENSRIFAKSFDWNIIFSSALVKSIF